MLTKETRSRRIFRTFDAGAVVQESREHDNVWLGRSRFLEALLEMDYVF